MVFPGFIVQKEEQPVFESPSRINETITSPSKKIGHKERHSSHHKTKRGEDKRRKKKLKPKCKCLSDTSSCGYNRDSSETIRNRLYETDDMAENKSRGNETYIKVDCLTLCQTYTCRVSEGNSSRSKQRCDEVYSPNKSSEIVPAKDGKMQSENDDFLLWIICSFGIPIVVVIILSVSVILFQKRKERRARNETKTTLRGLRKIRFQKSSIRNEDLSFQECKCNTYKHAVNIVDASEKNLIDLFESDPPRRQFKDVERVGTQYATDVKRVGIQYAAYMKRVGTRYATDVKRVGTQYATDVKRVDTQYATDVKRVDTQYATDVKRVGTQYATVTDVQEHVQEPVISCVRKLEEKINSKGRTYDHDTEESNMFIETDIVSNKCSSGTIYQAISENKSKNIEGDVADTERNQQKYKESGVAYGIDVKVSIVQPLGAADEKTEAATPPHVLNWDEIFRHLAKNLPTSDWQLFFNILYGSCHHLLSEGRDMGSYISRVENNVRRSGGGVETLMFELFKQWKQLMGSDVNITCIEQALEDRSYNSTLEYFRKFMRNPPLLPEIPNRQRCQSLVSLDMNNTVDNKAFEYIPLVRPNYATFMLPSVPQYSIPQSENRRTHTVTSGPIIQEMEDQFSGESSFQSSSSTPSSGRESLLSSNDSSIGRKRKRLMPTRDNQGGEAQVTPRKQRRKDTTQHASLPLIWTKGRRRNKQRADTESELHEMKQSMIEMTKQYLPLSDIPLQAKQYNVYLEHTIECIIKQTTEPRHKVLSLSHKDFCNLETFETKRKEKFYFLYSGDCCLVLKHSQYETLRLYAEHARRNLVRDIKKKLDDKYKEPDALFLAHDGQPIIKKKKARKTRSNKEPTTREETMSCAAYDEEKHCLSSSANRRDILEDATNKFQNHEEYAESIESQDGAISGITSGRNAVVKPYSTEKKQPEKRNLGVFNKQDKSLNTDDSLEPCKRESECVKHQTDQNTQQLNNAVSSTKQAIQTEIEYLQVCETETGMLNNRITLNNENNITPVSNCETVDKTTLESSVDSSEEFEYERSTIQTHIYQHLTKTHIERCHSTEDASCEDKPTSVKMDTDNLSEVIFSNCEAVIHNVQENNFQINRDKNSELSTIKLHDKRSIVGIDQDRNDDTISDNTKRDLFGKTKEDFSKTTSNSSSGTTTEDLLQTVGSISLRDTKEGACSAVSEENISDTTSSKIALESGGAPAKELDDALVYACISSIMQAEPDVKSNIRDIDMNIELD